MNRSMVILLPLLLMSSVSSSQKASVLKRSYSTNPVADVLKSALLMGDLKTVKTKIGLLPIGVDYQYVYLGLAQTSEVCTFFLEAMFSYWFERIRNNPCESLEALIGGLERLSRSYPVKELDHGFRIMLVKLRRMVLLIPDVASSKKLSAHARQIPDYSFDENTLQMQSAYLAAMQGYFDNLSEDILTRMVKARHRTDVAHPLNPMDSSE